MNKKTTVTLGRTRTTFMLLFSCFTIYFFCMLSSNLYAVRENLEQPNPLLPSWLAALIFFAWASLMLKR